MRTANSALPPVSIIFWIKNYLSISVNASHLNDYLDNIVGILVPDHQTNSRTAGYKVKKWESTYQNQSSQINPKHGLTQGNVQKNPQNGTHLSPASGWQTSRIKAALSSGSALLTHFSTTLLRTDENYNFFKGSFCLIYCALLMHKIKSIFVMFSALFVWLVLKLMGGCFLLAIQLLFISHTGAAACCNCYGRIHLEKLDLDLDKLLTADTGCHFWWHYFVITTIMQFRTNKSKKWKVSHPMYPIFYNT